MNRHLEEHSRQTRLLREQAGLVNIIVTHWPPTLDAVALRFHGDGLNGYFVNDHKDLVLGVGPQCWISGHVQDPYGYLVGETRYVANPIGYPGEVPEVGGFQPDQIIEGH